MTVYTTKTIVATITGTTGDFVAAFDSYNIGIDGEHLKTKFDIVLPAAWSVFIATTPASFISVEYRNAKGRCGRSVNIAVPALITTHISYEIPRDALYAPETEFWFSMNQPIDATETRITKTAVVKCNVAEGHKAGTVPDPFGHDVIQQVRDEIAAADLLKLDKNFTTSTTESTLLATDIIPINKAAGTLKKSTLQVLSTWLADTTTHVFSTVSQNIRGAINELKAEITNLNYTGSTHDALVTGALIDSEGVDFGVGGFATYLDGRLDKWETKTSNRTVISVKDYGAKGDGLTNDYVAIAAAIEAVFAGLGGVVYFPTGNYKFGTTITFPSDWPVELRGAGLDATILSYTGSGNGIAMVGTSGHAVQKSKICDMRITGSATGNGIDLNTGAMITFRNLLVDNFVNGILIYNTYNVLLDFVMLTANSGEGLLLQDEANNITCNACSSWNNGNSGTLINGARSVNFNSCNLEVNEYGVIITGETASPTQSINFNGCYIEGNTTNDILITSLTGTVPTGVNINNCYFVCMSGKATTAIRVEYADNLNIDGCYFSVGTDTYAYSVYVVDSATVDEVIIGRNKDTSAGKIYQGSGTVIQNEKQLMARAFGRINISGGAITSFTGLNIASVTWVSTGIYEITLKQTMPDTNWFMIASVENGASYHAMGIAANIPTSTTVGRITTTDLAGTLADARTIVFAVYSL